VIATVIDCQPLIDVIAMLLYHDHVSTTTISSSSSSSSSSGGDTDRYKNIG